MLYRRICLFAFLLTVLSHSAAGQPRIRERGVMNAASYLTDGLPNAGIAQGSIFVIFGSGLGPGELVKAPVLPLTQLLAGTGVQVISGGIAYSAYLLYTVATQVSAVLPSTVPEGIAEFTVTYNGVVSNKVTARIRRSAVGIFTQNQAGSGPAIVQNYISPTEAPRLNGLQSGIIAGGVAILWATGLGPITANDAAAPPAGDLPVETEVLVGGRPAKVLYKGRSPQFPGLDQINFEVPTGVIGCYVPVAVRAGGILSNFASISVLSGGTLCGDDVTFRGALFNIPGANLRIGTVDMLHVEYFTPGASAPLLWTEYSDHRFFDVIRSDLSLLPRLGDLEVLPGTCTVITNAWSNPEDYEDIYPKLPDPSFRIPGGIAMTIKGPVATKTLTQDENHLGGTDVDLGLNSPPDPRFLVPGLFTFEDLAPPEPPVRRSTLRFNGEIQWTNRLAINTVDRTQDLTFQWTGGADGSEYVLVGGSSASEALQARVTFVCAERPSRGSLTVPAEIVALLPRNTTNPTDRFPYGMVFAGTSSLNGNSLQAERGTLSMLYFRYLYLYYALVDFR